ncbi:sensor histidine kinase [Robiginitalea sp. SC105]|uniref:sensor histidine kinase n=1 Tax=Robiginitalea sp. SC105 TaxID=2762332 RepID=UPI00163A5F5E|nr:sensor histidine kinase [Robiginitalea sp. SC105]MBC2839781.1 hypothetical protein [Robiginitalea sp. SC105]
MCVIAFWMVFYSGVVSGQSQKIIFEEVLTPGGDPLGKITSIAEDKRGFIWFSDVPNQMIVRYDGSQMKYFRHDRENPNSLGGTYPHDLYADSSGFIWIALIGEGLDKYDPYTDTFTHYRHDPDDPESLINKYVHTVIVDRNGMVWAGTSEGLDRLDPNTGKFTHFRHDENDPTSLSHNVVRTLYEDSEGTIWAGTGFPYDYFSDAGGLNRFNPESGTFTRYLHDPEDPTSLISNKVSAILEDSYGNFWVGTDGDGLHTMDRKTGRFTRHTHDPALPDNLSRPAIENELWAHITFLIEDSMGQIWIGTVDNGVNRYDPVNKKVTHYGAATENPEGVIENEDWDAFARSNSAWCALASDEGIIWIMTEEKPRLFKIDLFWNDFPIIKENQVKDFYEESPNILWKASEGLIREDIATGKRTVYKNIPGDTTSISNDVVNSVTKDRYGKIWAATAGGLNELDPETGQFTRYSPDPKDPESLAWPWVSDVLEDSSYDLWVGTTGGGLHLLKRESGTFKIFRNDPQDSTSLAHDEVYDLAEDPSGNLWIGTAQGLSRLDPSNGSFRTYLRGYTISSLLLDGNGDLWVAGGELGLFKYDPKIGRFVNSGIQTIPREVLHDSENNIWIHNTTGLLKYNPKSGTTLEFGAHFGIRGFLMNATLNYPYRKKDGTLLFGMNDGYYAFNPEQLWQSRDTSLLYATELEIKGESNSGNSLSLIDLNGQAMDVTLKSDQNSFSISYSAIDFRSSGGKEVMYMLEGYDPGWLQGSAELPVNYAAVPPGAYTFRLKAQNSSSGLWSENEVQLEVLPPWWATWWAYTAYTALFLLGLWQLYHYQKERVLRLEREKAQKVKLEQALEIKKAYEKLEVAHTHLKSTQAQLIHSEKMASLGELTAGIAHEIQNPLNFVNNFSEVSRELVDEMKEEIKKKDYQEVDAIANDLKQNLEKINHHGNRAGDIVKGMLQHSRSSEGKQEPTDLNKLADEYLRLAYHGLRAKDKSFNAIMETDFDLGLPEISVIPQDIGRVMLNLLTNAFHAVQERQKKGEAGYQPTVTVSTKKTNAGVEIRVTDNGGGIPEGIREKIFQPFFTTKPTGEGTGLGLSMSYDIVTKGHGGQLKVESKTGEGSEFCIILNE